MRVAKINQRLDREALGGTVGGGVVTAGQIIIEGGLAAAPFVGPAISKVIDRGKEEMKRATEANMRRLVDAQVQDLLVAGSDPAAVRANASQTVGSLIGPGTQFPSLFDDSTAYDALQDAAVAYLARRVDELAQIGNTTAGNLKAVQSDVSAQTKTLKQLKATIGGLEKSKQETEQAAASAAASRDTPSGSAGTAARQENFRISAAKFAAVGAEASRQIGAAADIIGHLGGDPRALRTVANVVGVAAGLAASYANPLYLLPTLASAGSMFGGGGGPDPLLKAIMQEIQALRKEMHEFREEVQQQHREQMLAIGGIQIGLVGLLAEIQTVQDQSLGDCWNLLPNPYDITVLGQPTDLPRQYAWSTAYSTSRVQPALLNSRELRPVTYGDIKAFYNNHGSQIEKCLTVLGQIYTRAPQLSSRLRLSTVISLAAPGAPNSVLVQVGQPLHESYKQAQELQRHLHRVSNVLKRSATFNELGASRNLLAWTLSTPSGDVGSLAKKMSRPELVAKATVNSYPESATSQGPQRTSEYQDWVIGQPVDAEYIATTASLVLLAAWWHEFSGPNGVRNLDDLSVQDAGETVARLQRALHAVRIALAQQSALSGDMLLHLAADKLDERKEIPKVLDEKEKNWWLSEAGAFFDDAISANPLFAQNLGLYWASRRVPEGSRWSYEVAWQVNGSPVLMVKVLEGVPGSLEWRDDRWWIIRPGPRGPYGIPLPTPEELRAGALLQNGILGTLVELDAQLSRELLLYRAAEPGNQRSDDYRELARAGLLRL